jgi:hypothetical protein
MSYRLDMNVRMESTDWCDRWDLYSVLNVSGTTNLPPELNSTLEYNTRLVITMKVKSNYKAKNSANNVEVCIPVPCDSQSPSFKVYYFTLFPYLKGFCR